MHNEILNHLPKAIRIKEEIKAKIHNGRLGKVGEVFLSVRKLAKFTGVSLVTAHRVMTMLKEDGTILLKNGRHVIARTEKSKKKQIYPNNTNDKLIGFVVTNIENPFFAALAREMEQAAGEASLQLMIASSNYDINREKQAIEMFLASGVCGIVSCPGLDEDASELYSGLTTPFVFVGRKVKGVSADSVLVESFNAAQLVASHFISGGYKNFGYFGLEKIATDQRLNGFRYGIKEMGYALNTENILKSNDMTYSEVTSEILKFIDEISKPAAIFCFHDLLALLLIKACAELELSIPDDVAIAGFDNLPFASRTIPSLTTVGYPLRTMVRLAVNRLLDKTSSGSEFSNESATLFVKPKLYVRQSTSKSVEKDQNKILLNDLIYQAS